MVNKKTFIKFALLLFSVILVLPTFSIALADTPTSGAITQDELDTGGGSYSDVEGLMAGEQTSPDVADIQAKLASTPAECGSTVENVMVDGHNQIAIITPINCLFLDEPIGGTIGFDLYYSGCYEATKAEGGGTVCSYTKWSGGEIPAGGYGPLQAILTSRPGAEYQGPFGLLYSYISLVYGYMSGLIVGVVVLYVVIGGIQMSTAGGDQGKFENGKSRIVKAIVGMILWFTASLILYTINPTFFAF